MSYRPPPNPIPPPPPPPPCPRKKGLDYEALWEISKQQARTKQWPSEKTYHTQALSLKGFLEYVLPRHGEWNKYMQDLVEKTR
jgi:hypothetical protein